MGSIGDFGWALDQLKQGLKVKRPAWVRHLELQRPDEHSKMKNPYIFAVCKGGEIVPAVINNLDLMAEDWQIVE